jgi:hypothetical protein
MRRSSRPSVALLLAGLLAGGCGDDGESAPHDAGTPPHDAAIEQDAQDAESARDASAYLQATRSLATSATHSCALRRSGVYCWGSNFAGQLGTESDAGESEVPARVESAGEDIVEIAASSGRTCVRRSTGQLACWGANNYGQIGDGTREERRSAVMAMGVDDAVQLAMDDASTCVLREAGDVACWGNAPAGSPGAGSLVPVSIEGIEGAVELRGGVFETYCARGAEGWVRCFGFQGGGWTAPIEVAALQGVRAVALGGNEEICAITEARDIVCHNTTSGRTLALAHSERSVEIVGTSLVVCAMNEDGDWRCWNILTQLLDMIGSVAIEVPSDVQIVEAAPAGFNACVLRADRSIGCATATDNPPTLELIDVPE